MLSCHKSVKQLKTRVHMAEMLYHRLKDSVYHHTESLLLFEHAESLPDAGLIEAMWWWQDVLAFRINMTCSAQNECSF